MGSLEASGPDPDVDRPGTHLVKRFDKVVAELNDQIEKGRELRSQLDHSALPIPERLAVLGAKYWSWHDENERCLEDAFSTKEIVESYLGLESADPGGVNAFGDLLRDVAFDLMRDIGFLAGLRDRLKAYMPPAHP